MTKIYYANIDLMVVLIELIMHLTIMIHKERKKGERHLNDKKNKKNK